MRFNKKMYGIAAIMLSIISLLGSKAFAGPVIGDVPSGPNENRTIQQASTLYTESCDITQELAFYNGSPVYLRVAQPKSTVSYVFDKVETYVRVYGGNVFAGNLKFPYISNFVPSTTIDPGSTPSILTVDATGSTFSGQAATPRNQIAGQLVTKNNERSIVQNTNGATLNYYYRWATDNSLHNGTLKVVINANLTKKTSCTNYYVARCGDGIIDKPTGTTNGNGGITTQGNVFLPWHTVSIKPNEICDDGALNGTPGKCKTDCTGLGGNATDPSCTLTANVENIQPGQSAILNGSYERGVSANFSPFIPGITFTYPTRSNNNIVVTPTSTTTYTLTVNGEAGTTPAVCSKTITVNQGSGPSCTLTANTENIEPGQSAILNGSYANATSANFSPFIPGINFTYPTRNDNNIVVTPTSTTTYTLTANGGPGTTPAVCSKTITVTPHLRCTLSFSPNPTLANTPVAVGWNVSNGNFYGTYIYVTPQVPGARPHRVNANQYNGVTYAQPTHTGDFNFSMTVNNNIESYTCTGLLRVVDNTPSACTLTTTTPLINPGENGILQGSYTNASLATMTPNIGGLNFTYPNRSNNTIVVNPRTTTTYTLTTMGLLGQTGAICNATINVMNEGVTLTKSLVTNIPYRSGDLVAFKIEFANRGKAMMNISAQGGTQKANTPIDAVSLGAVPTEMPIDKAASTGDLYNPGGSTVTNMVLSDYLPAGLEYVNSQLYGVSSYTMRTGANGGNQFVEYAGFSLAPGQQGYMLIVGRFKGYEYSNQTLNNAFLKGDNLAMLYASAMFYVENPIGNTAVVKTSDKPAYGLGENARFTIAVTNNGAYPMSNVEITDTRPTSPCITLDSQRSSNMPLTMTNPNNPYTRTYNGSLAVGQTIYLYLTGHISSTPSCIGSYANNAGIRYTANGQTQTANAQALNFTVSAAPGSVISFEKKVVQYGNKAGDPVVFELVYQNNGSTTITNYDIVDYRPGTLNFVSASPMPTTQSIVPTGTLHRLFSTPLAPGASGKITINATIK